MNQLTNLKALLQCKINAELSNEELPITFKLQLSKELHEARLDGVLYVPVTIGSGRFLFNTTTERLSTLKTTVDQKLTEGLNSTIVNKGGTK